MKCSFISALTGRASGDRKYLDRDQFDTKDLWVEHPAHKGLWKIIGGSDDYVLMEMAYMPRF